MRFPPVSALRAFACLAAAPSLTAAAYGVAQYRAAAYTIAEGYAVRFDGRGASGTFSDLEGEIEFDPTAPARARVDVRVATATVSTGNTTKDEHARGESWLDAEAYPTIRIRSTAFAKAPDGYRMSADLTLHGQTHPVEIPFTFTPAPDGAQAGAQAGGTFRGAFTVDRGDYGIEGSFGQFVVADELDVTLVVPVR